MAESPKERPRERLTTDARREQLLVTGTELLQHRPHTEVSIEEIAEAAGVSKGLLYHYFPTKNEFIVAALERGQRELAARLVPDESLPPIKRLDASLDAFLDYVEAHPAAFAAIFRGGSEDPEITKALDAGRNEQLATLMAAIGEWEEAPVSTEATPELEAAVFANWADLLLASFVISLSACRESPALTSGFLSEALPRILAPAEWRKSRQPHRGQPRRCQSAMRVEGCSAS